MAGPGLYALLFVVAVVGVLMARFAEPLTDAARAIDLFEYGRPSRELQVAITRFVGAGIVVISISSLIWLVLFG